MERENQLRTGDGGREEGRTYGWKRAQSKKVITGHPNPDCSLLPQLPQLPGREAGEEGGPVIKSSGCQG